jgi:hypothetical protein
MSVALKTDLKKQFPVLFAHVGWAEYYDGTEPIHGNFSWLKDNPTENWEANAFRKADDGYFRCGVGRGAISSMPHLHVVFVARHPLDHDLKVVGIYAAAAIASNDDTWRQVRAKNALLFPVGLRPSVPAWPGKQGTRRWAWRGDEGGSQHRSLYRLFDRLKNNIMRGHDFAEAFDSTESIDTEIHAFEGKVRLQFIKHRKREACLRREKLREVLSKNNGRLVCEVPKCNFDFMKRYGQLGAGYAQVHHKKPLGAAPQKGQLTSLKELAVVCANCHAMIHKGGVCRPLTTLIP